jgi:HAD superfamily hydrolase (TIGR01458 family)
MDISTKKAVLFDLDGVLYTGNQPIDGAIQAVKQIRDAGMACRFLTNTSTLSIASLQKKLMSIGFDVVQSEIISAPQAARLWIEQQSNPICRLVVTEDVKQDFAHLPQSNTDARFIVVGDIGDTWTYAMLNELFTCLMRGAKLIAIHKNRFWQTAHGLQMDIGAFIHGLEYASQTEAIIIGKPSKDFFNMALSSLSLQAEQVCMVGDDIDSDIGGALAAGIDAILVRTGKYRAAYAQQAHIQPTATINSVADLVSLLIKTPPQP